MWSKFVYHTSEKGFQFHMEIEFEIEIFARKRNELIENKCIFVFEVLSPLQGGSYHLSESLTARNILTN